MTEMTNKDKETKKELIKSIQSILNANKDNDYCCQYWLANMIKEKFKLYEIYDWNNNISWDCFYFIVFVKLMYFLIYKNKSMKDFTNFTNEVFQT